VRSCAPARADAVRAGESRGLASRRPGPASSPAPTRHARPVRADEEGSDGHDRARHDRSERGHHDPPLSMERSPRRPACQPWAPARAAVARSPPARGSARRPQPDGPHPLGRVCALATGDELDVHARRQPVGDGSRHLLGVAELDS
jgi:hypothetical protein